MKNKNFTDKRSLMNAIKLCLFFILPFLILMACEKGKWLTISAGKLNE